MALINDDKISFKIFFFVFGTSESSVFWKKRRRIVITELISLENCVYAIHSSMVTVSLAYQPLLTRQFTLFLFSLFVVYFYLSARPSDYGSNLFHNFYRILCLWKHRTPISPCHPWFVDVKMIFITLNNDVSYFSCAYISPWIWSI